ncbi:hypothetical protein D8B22_12130 [Verminephrobacter aporrectodeae subsp. tuberculatae]|uniref:efflux RND transporter permease subunit n=1 Tax=Verminephrobacter aporrectodeae TaxID=1110389 RepID=UPI0002F2A3A4|nr:MMPL family transporter [Verminephrobacter aporrectodeae]MCW5256841.1 hypothetical protein [Verminephrobacter aporrectodeae subsp. tuberculatae]MCW8164352.1 hypothetical protein [Verminephrobacter aporrectodeae subsp. tuberculatae]MCW8169835.1 hypothetical protein [Verminephrobacter aporrectodeae subsp. tuberculatae]
MTTLNPMQRLTLHLGLWAARHPWLAIGVVTLLTAIFCVGLGTLRVDASNNAMFGHNDNAQIDYEAFQKEFGREDAVVVAIRSPRIFTSEFMVRLRALHEQLEAKVPWVEEVTSLANVTYVDSADGTVRTSKLGDRWPDQGALPEAIRNDLLKSSLYRRTLLSPDGGTTLLIVRPQTFVTPAALEAAAASGQSGGNALQHLGQSIRAWHDRLDANLGAGAAAKPVPALSAKGGPTPAQPTDATVEDIDLRSLQATGSAPVRLPGSKLVEFNDAVRRIADEFRQEEMEIHISGGPVIDEAHETSVHQDLGLMTGLSLAVVVVALMLQLRSTVGVLVPVLVVGMSLLATLGAMGWIGFPITVVSQALPPIMLTMGVLSSIHMLTTYLQDPEPDFEQAVRNMFHHCGDPVVYTVLTDVLAFLAFSIARLEPIAEFGLMAAFGSMIGLVYTLLLLPALLRIGRIKHDPTHKNIVFFGWLSNIVTPVGLYCHRHYRAVLLATVLLIGLMIPGIWRIQYAHDVLTWFQPEHVLRRDTMAIDAQMQSSIPLEIVIDTRKDEGILTPEFMLGLRSLQDYAASLSNEHLQIGSTNSIVDSIQRVHQVLTGGSGDALPGTRELLHQELLLFEGGGAKEIKRLTDRRYSKARVTVRMAWADAHAFIGLDDKFRTKVVELFGKDVRTTVTGVAYMQSIGALDVIDSMWSSYLLSALLIAGMLFVVLREFKISLASIVPNFLPVWISLGVMGYLGLPVDMFMVLLGGIALAVSVDDTVHFMHTVMRHRRTEGVEIEAAVRTTLKEVGAPLVIASMVTACAFFTFSFSSIIPLSRFGVILSSTLVIALLLDVVVSPALVTGIARLEARRMDKFNKTKVAS